MTIIFEIIDRTKRKIYLTEERWKHICSRHPDIMSRLWCIEETLINPNKMIDHSSKEDRISHYYRYYKDVKRKAKYLRVIVKYLNGSGFVITSSLVERIR